MQERKDVELIRTTNSKNIDKDAIDKEVYAFQQEEEDRLIQERQKKIQYYNMLQANPGPQLYPNQPHSSQIANQQNQYHENLNSYHDQAHNYSRLSNNPLSMDNPQTDTSKRDHILAQRLMPKQQVSANIPVGNQPHIDSRLAYQAIKQKQTASKGYNLLTGV
jgi:hypothetical protein